MSDTGSASGNPLAAGWEWLASLPRATTAHADRGADPLAAPRALLAALGNPQDRLRVIHIAGSKGKGSTALLVEALLRRLGRRCFTYTSPHLQRWTERFRIEGAEADAEAALASLEAVQAASRETGIVPGFFEGLTVAGFHLAARQGIEWAVIEAGVGGRADATNVVAPAMTVITGIELEHTDRLGDTLEAIAAEKAGIVKSGVPLVTPELSPGPEAVVDQAAERAGAERIVVRRTPVPARAPRTDRQVAWHYARPVLTAAGRGWTVRTEIDHPGAFVGDNAALALAVVARLGLASAEHLHDAARVLGEVRLPGRMEAVSTLPWVIIDSAHTPSSARALVDTVAELDPERIHLLLSVSASKDVDALLAALLPGAAAVTATRADPQYSMPAAELAAAIHRRRPYLPVEAAEDPDRALAIACADTPGQTLVLATGSVYLAGHVRAAFLG